MVDLSSLSGSLGSFKSGFAGFATYLWVLYIFVPLALIIVGGYIWKLTNDKKKQWTHKLIIKRAKQDNSIMKEVVIIKMRRFPLINHTTVFELEKPVLGSYLIPELDSYTGMNEFSIVIDKHNRIYINTGEIFIPENSSINVSAKHAGIDLAFEDLRADWQNINKISKRVEWSQIAKFALLGLLIIAVMVVAIKGIGQWGENHQMAKEKAQAEAEAMRNLAEAMQTSQATMNAQILVLELLKEGYGTKNIQPIIREKINGTI